MPRAKSIPAGRDLVLGKLAARAGMTMEEWTKHLQTSALANLQQDDPAEYAALTAEIMAELLGDIPPPPPIRTPPPRKVCPACDEERHANQYTKGSDICKACVTAGEADPEPAADADTADDANSRPSVPLSAESKRLRDNLLAGRGVFPKAAP